jgi:hypothetical protein
VEQTTAFHQISRQQIYILYMELRSMIHACVVFSLCNIFFPFPFLMNNEWSTRIAATLNSKISALRSPVIRADKCSSYMSLFIFTLPQWLLFELFFMMSFLFRIFMNIAFDVCTFCVPEKVACIFRNKKHVILRQKIYY